MTAEQERAAERLRTVVLRLNQQTYAGGQTVKEVETFLAETGMGLSVEVQVDTKPATDDQRVGARERFGKYEVDTRLAYARHAGVYRVVVRKVLTGATPDRHGEFDHEDLAVLDEKPWASCPRDLKFQTFPRLPALIEEIAANAERLAKEVDETVDTVRGLIGAVGPFESLEPLEPIKDAGSLFGTFVVSQGDLCSRVRGVQVRVWGPTEDGILGFELRDQENEEYSSELQMDHSDARSLAAYLVEAVRTPKHYGAWSKEQLDAAHERLQGTPHYPAEVDQRWPTGLALEMQKLYLSGLQCEIYGRLSAGEAAALSPAIAAAYLLGQDAEPLPPAVSKPKLANFDDEAHLASFDEAARGLGVQVGNSEP